jgi:hypothetical protein
MTVLNVKQQAQSLIEKLPDKQLSEVINMGSITIQVDAEVAKAYQEINSTNRKRIEMLFNILVQKELKEISLMQIMDNIGYQAEKNGLTPEILESILADED